MNIIEQTVSIFLSDDGRSALGLAGVTAETSELLVDVEDTDDMGVWVRIPRGEEEHTILIRWDYILTIDFPSEEKRIAGVTS